ncbi:hypothetical protein LTS12_015409 [Elasticomyces elasticus]|nr:hypothetical protein LTS12_015409 [Elasticomyces elasticus]
MPESQLLKLPAELCNRIWDFAVVETVTLYIELLRDTNDQTGKAKSKILPEQSAITRVDQQTRAEALPMFYHSNSFVVEHGYLMLLGPGHFKTMISRFANEIARRHVARIRYSVTKYRGTNITQSTIFVHQNEPHALDFILVGEATQACTCYTMAELRRLAATKDPGAGATGNLALDVASSALATIIVPSLLKVLDMRSVSIVSRQRFGMPDFADIPVCSHCRKPRWRTTKERAEIRASRGV